MRSAERSEVYRLLDSMDVVGIGERAARQAAEFMRTYRRSHASIGLGDYLIAGSASAEGLDLKTLNVKHFPMFPDLTPPFDLN
jgi:predicted nucleic acid-binding protein